jgi:sortase A
MIWGAPGGSRRAGTLAAVKLARALSAIGRVMITAGVLILLFVAYQLWGTGLHTARAQDDAASALQEQAEDAGVDLDERPPEDAAPIRRRQPVPAVPPRGEPVGVIDIPAIGVHKFFFVGVGLDVLSKGPGHYEGTPLPGQRGNAGIAGHRTTYGAPFNRLDELGEGDRIIITYANGSRFTYEYNDTYIVRPEEVDVLHFKFDNRLTLTACHPKYSAAERIVVSARLLDRAARPPRNQPPPEEAEVVSLDDAESLDGQDHAKTPAVVWGIAAAMVWLAAWVVGRAWRRLPAYALGLPIFLVMLYGFFENFSYLLPSSY